MHKYVIKRLLYMIPVLLGVAFLVFTILSLTPGDPGSIILGITAKPEDIAALNAEFGYDQPFLVRFFNYIGDIIFHFSLGTSYQTRQPVIEDIMARFPNTLLLTVFSMSIASIGYFFRNPFRCQTVFRSGPHAGGGGSDFCLHPRFLARTYADAFILPEASLAALLRRRKPETLYSADVHGLYGFGRGPFKADPVGHAGDGPSGVHPHRKGKGSFTEAHHLEACPS